MNHDLRRCPTCGAYVMTGDNICPRCDAPLDGSPLSENLPDPDPISTGDETILEAFAPDRSQLPTTLIPEVDAPAEDSGEGVSDPAEEQLPDEQTDLAPAEVPPVDAPSEEDPEGTATHLETGIVVPVIDESELPTADYRPGEKVIRPAPAAAPTTFNLPPILIPPAPPTPVRAPIPDPAWITPPPAPLPAYRAAAPDRLGQRVQVYQRGGYRLHSRTAHAATLSRGKTMGMIGWLLAFISIIGALWYLLLAALGGFRADRVYITREADGSLYEDGAGAAHVRQQRARVGQRWAIFGGLIFAACLLLAILLGIAGGIVTAQDRYQAALRDAYPAVTLFEERFSQAEADPDDVALVKDGAVAYAILAGIAGVGLWGGATLFVIGTIHAGAYRVTVPPLPGMR